MSQLITPFFDKNAAVIVKLTEWMEWSSGKPDALHNVVLPMIQRGSVWAPHKLLDLWDTLLRGMPLGALMASEAGEGAVKILNEAGPPRDAKTSDIALIDGQQRTLAMLAGWPKGLQNPLRPVALWVDLADEPQGEYRFRLWATTKAQPFGYARASMGGQPLNKLERKKLRLANQVFHPSESTKKIEVQTLWQQPDFMPWDAKFALPLADLIEQKIKLLKEHVAEFGDVQKADLIEHHGKLLEFVKRRLIGYKAALEIKAAAGELEPHFAHKLLSLPDAESAALAQRVALFEDALDRLFTCKFPVIHVRKECFDQSASGTNDNDPALAILFKRVGTGGEPLSNADYVYCVIKHYAPQVHSMVEKLLEDQKVRAIYTPTTLVMSAVRLTMLSLANTSLDAEARKFTDTAKLEKAAFARMVRNHPEFMGAFESHIQLEGGIFVTSLNDVLSAISYTENFTLGLPKHALCLVQIPLLETLLAWHTLSKPSKETLKSSRLAMVRFVLQGYLCILDYAKASEAAVRALNGMNESSPDFPDQALLAALADSKNRLAYPLPSPAMLSEIENLTATAQEIDGLLGWTRFYFKDQPDKQQCAELYKRWWNRSGRHTHPLLLWLQRKYVFDKFEQEPALAGMDEETPFDFDHILPSAQWVCGTGNSGPHQLMAFCHRDGAGKFLDKNGHSDIGNSLGNIHVLDSSYNRSLGDSPVSAKLNEADFGVNAQISNQAEWLAASGDEKDSRHWDAKRARAFQTAVEQRAFAMYQKFYADLHCAA